MSPQDGEQLLARILGEERVAAEGEAAREICALLQNLPLAVEITAQRLHSRPRRRLADMAQRLHNVQDRLDLAISDRAVRTSFMVSWESLDNALRRAFALLGVFGGRTFDAPALAYLAELDVYTTEDRLFALTALSLLTEEAEDRYRQHPLLADFAREQLGDDRNALRRMAAYYLAFAQEYQTDYSMLQPEWENMMAGMRAAYTLQEWPLVLEYAETLTGPWFTRARYSEAREAYPLAHEAAELLKNQDALALCLLRWGQACIEQYDYDEAQGFLAASMHLYETQGNVPGIANVKYHLARIAIELANYAEAEQLLNTSYQLHEQVGDNPGLAADIYQQALIFYRRGELDKSEALCKRALAKQEAAGDRLGSLPTLRLLADIALEQKNYNGAESYCQQALNLSNDLQNRGELAATYYGLTVVARLQEKYEIAKVYAEKALELCEWTGNRGFQAVTLYELSQIHANAQNYPLALSNGSKSIQLLRELKDSYNLVNILRYVGDIHRNLKQQEQARLLWAEALTLAEVQKHPLLNQLQQRLAYIA
jgi:tetratricopeptide (TPR) repeat protein